MKKDFYIVIDLANDGMMCAMLGSEKLARRWIAMHDTSDRQSTNNFRIVKILGVML